MKAVYKRELKSYFNSMVGYVFIAILVFVVGIYFAANNIIGGYPKFSYTLASVVMVFMVAIPILTMRSMAEERHNRTDQMFMTYPVSLGGVVMGKYLAMVTVLLIPTVLFAFCPLIIRASGEAYFLNDYSTLLAFFLMGCVYIAVGMFISALTESQVIAAVGSFLVLLVLNLWGGIAGLFPDAVSEVLSTFTFQDVLYNFADYSVFDVGGLVLYLSMAALFVFLTVQVLRKRRGGAVVPLAAIGIVLAVVVNLVIGQVPAGLKEFDISGSRIYTVSEEAQAYLDGLQEEIELVVTSDEGGVDARVVKYLHRYDAASDKVSLKFVDPVVYPSVLEEYQTRADAVAVRCVSTGKTKTVSLMDMIQYDEYKMYYQQYEEIGFDAEGQVTSAIDYVVNETNYKAYALAGHSEVALSAQVTDAIEKTNVGLGTLNLMMDGGIPEDCDLLIAFAPNSDLSSDELKMIRDYLTQGGDMMLVLGDTYDLPNWNALSEEYGLQRTVGCIADMERYYPQMNSPFAFFPVLSSENNINLGLTANDMVMLLYPWGLNQVTPARETITVSPFMTTSASGMEVALEAEEGVTGTFVLGAVATEGDTRFTVITSKSIVDESLLTSFPSLVNLTVFMRALTGGMEGVDGVSIPVKSLEVPYNVVTNAGLLSLLYIVVIPLALLVGGLIYWNKRRKR